MGLMLGDIALWALIATALFNGISMLINARATRVNSRAMQNQEKSIETQTHFMVTNELSKKWEEFNQIHEDITKEEWARYKFAKVVNLLEDLSHLDNENIFGKITSEAVGERVSAYLIGILDYEPHLNRMKELKRMSDEKTFERLDKFAEKHLDNEHLEKFRKEIMSISPATPRKK